MKKLNISVTREEFINGKPFVAPDVSSRKFMVSSFKDNTKYISYDGVYYCSLDDITDTCASVYGLSIFNIIIRAELIFKKG